MTETAICFCLNLHNEAGPPDPAYFCGGKTAEVEGYMGAESLAEASEHMVATPLLLQVFSGDIISAVRQHCFCFPVLTGRESSRGAA